MNEEISQILNRDLIVSNKRGVFSSPNEICKHVNTLLDASFSSRAISVELQEIGWQRCGSSRAKRKIDNRASAYYWKENRQSKALLSPNAQSQHKSAEDGESLSSINRRYRAAQADKERALASTRSVEVSTSKVKRDHLEISLARERNELISVDEVQRIWQASLVYIKQGLYTLPSRFSERWAGITNDQIISDELTTQIDALLTRFAQDGERVVTGENEDTETDNE